MSVGLIPYNRLKWIPKNLRFAHSYCFFLHDECVRALVEYEHAKAHFVTVKFESNLSPADFKQLADNNPIDALLRTGYPSEARRVVINTICMAMVSDCLHHLYEALKCFEKRKVVVGFNLLRKPLKQNLLYLSWILGDEDGFYTDFMSGNPENLSQKKIGNIRKELLKKAIKKIPHGDGFDADILEKIIYDRKYKRGFEELFEHAVHLITVERLELRTTPQNFNFIFKRHSDNDIYDAIYSWLPYIIFFLARVIITLFDRMENMDDGTKTAFAVRSMFACMLIKDGNSRKFAQKELATIVGSTACMHCESPLKLTLHNAQKILLTHSFRCSVCRKTNVIPFSWSF